MVGHDGLNVKSTLPSPNYTYFRRSLRPNESILCCHFYPHLVLKFGVAQFLLSLELLGQQSLEIHGKKRMSSLFSIGEDDLDFDDEDCLLAACGFGSANNCTSNNSRMNPNLSITETSLLRSKEIDKPGSHCVRRAFDTISNINTRDRACDRKRTFVENLHSSSSVTWPKNNAFSPANGLNGPVTKRLATENDCNLFPKSAVSGKEVTLLHLSSMPTVKSADNSSLVKSSVNSQTLVLPACNLKTSKLDVPSRPIQSNSQYTPNCLAKKENSGLCRLSTKDCQHLNSTDIKMSTTVQPQKPSLIGSPAINNNRYTVNSTRATGSTNTLQRHSDYNDRLNINGTRGSKAPESPPCTGLKKINAVPTTSLEFQSVTPVRKKTLANTPSSSKTPKMRKFPGPAGVLPKLSPGQNLNDPYFASPLPSAKKPSPVQRKVSQSSSSEDEDFCRDPWNCMYQDFIKNIPNQMRYTIFRVYTEAIHQQLKHGKVPCLCAVVKAFSLTEADASVLLKDPTGEIHGTLHRKVLESYQTELAPGAGLILKQVSVFSPAPRRYYLNITPGNILQIYPPDPQNITSSQALASQCTQAEENKKELRVFDIESVCRTVDCSERQNDTSTVEEGSWLQEDCFEDILDDLDDEDFLDDALLV